jgi:hypothetical protein
MCVVDDVLLDVYCLFDDFLRALLRQLGVRRLRQRGPDPALSDAEALTILVVGEWLGHHNDSDIHRHAHLHWRDAFPDLPCLTSFGRQLANLSAVCQAAWQFLLHLLGVLHDDLYLADSFPLVSCKWGRAPQRKRLRDVGSIGYCATKKMWYFGLKGHLLIHHSGVIVGVALTPASEHDRPALDLLAGHGLCQILGDMAYLCKWWQEHMLQERGIRVVTRFKKNMADTNAPEDKHLLRTLRMKVETVNGQLQDRFGLARLWAQDEWHLQGRVMRKVLAHTLGIYFNVRDGRPPLQLSGLFPV